MSSLLILILSVNFSNASGKVECATGINIKSAGCPHMADPTCDPNRKTFVVDGSDNLWSTCSAAKMEIALKNNKLKESQLRKIFEDAINTEKVESIMAFMKIKCNDLSTDEITKKIIISNTEKIHQLLNYKYNPSRNPDAGVDFGGAIMAQYGCPQASMPSEKMRSYCNQLPKAKSGKPDLRGTQSSDTEK